MHHFDLDASFPDHPDTVRFASLLGIDLVTAWGHLCAFRCRVAQYVETGDLNGIHPETIALWCRWEKDPMVFFRALCEAGAIDTTTLQVHNWKKRYWPALKKRNGMRALRAKVEEAQGAELPSPVLARVLELFCASMPPTRARALAKLFLEKVAATTEADDARTLSIAEHLGREAQRANNPVAWLSAAIARAGWNWSVKDTIEEAEKEADRARRAAAPAGRRRNRAEKIGDLLREEGMTHES